jgi:hypothetical protein
VIKRMSENEADLCLSNDNKDNGRVHRVMPSGLPLSGVVCQEAGGCS